jgi:predicted double-glycine peptidase
MNIKDIYAQHNVSIQKEPFSCGPVAILNALQLKGDTSHTEKDLIKLCKAKLGAGTSNKDLVKAIEQVELEIVEEKNGASLKDIERNVDHGASVIVCYKNAFSGNGHYTVITQHDDGGFYCRDSAFGLFRIEKGEFDKHWYNPKETAIRWFVAVK